MDSTASSLSMDNDIPLVVFNLNEQGNIRRAILGEHIGTTVRGNRMADKILTEAKDKMKKAAENLQRELGQIRAGRANAKYFRPCDGNLLWCSNTTKSNGINHDS